MVSGSLIPANAPANERSRVNATSETAHFAARTSTAPSASAEGCATIRLVENLGDKATPHSRQRPVAEWNLTTISPLEGPGSASQILSRPVRRKARAGRGCMAVRTDLGANEPRCRCSSRNLSPDRVSALLLPQVLGAVRLRPQPAFPFRPVCLLQACKQEVCPSLPRIRG